MAIDLHTHSTASDGSDAPAEVVAAAARAGLHAIALTDHDTLEGIPAAAAAAREAGIAFVPGIELSVEWERGIVHLLAYFITPGPGPLQDRIVALQQSREDRNRRIAQALADLGIDITYGEVVTESATGVTGRPHFARVLVRKGVVPDANAAFDRYLAEGRPAYRDRMRLTIEAALRFTRESGGVPVLAHPHTMGIAGDAFRATVGSLVAEGLGGIEAYYPEYPAATRSRLASLAAEFGIAATGGSDYHGSYKPGLRLGRGYGDLEVPDEALPALERAR